MKKIVKYFYLHLKLTLILNQSQDEDYSSEESSPREPVEDSSPREPVESESDSSQPSPRQVNQSTLSPFLKLNVNL